MLRIRHKALSAPGADTGANLRRKGLRNASLPSESATLALGEFSRSSRVVPVLQFAPKRQLWPAATDAIIYVLFLGFVLESGSENLVQNDGRDPDHD